MDLRAFNRLIGPLKRRVAMLCGRGVVDVADDTKKMQEVQCRSLDREVMDEAEHWQPYGLTYHPLPGGEALFICPGGDRAHMIAIAVADRRHRPTGLLPGEVMIYDDLGKSILFKRNGDIHVTANRLVVDADVEISGNVEVVGNVHATGTIIDDLGNTPNHNHP